MSKRRSCCDATYYHDLRELRAWRDRLLSEENSGKKRHMLSSRPEVVYYCWDAGWTTWVTMQLEDGYEIHLSSTKWGGLKWNPGYEESACLKLYAVLSKRLRGRHA